MGLTVASPQGAARSTPAGKDVEVFQICLELRLGDEVHSTALTSTPSPPKPLSPSGPENTAWGLIGSKKS
ncbi:hypothetical protein E2C01_049555 [Portunus trituberculatus]|uniref:Uncharacterized protein n=1 Tax=Portunus trituberculatus TaxID=210409 RepID=A0A5B7G6Q0_PORTR|nr:hypothetical protein [Portunus trituberculatus]